MKQFAPCLIIFIDGWHGCCNDALAMIADTQSLNGAKTRFGHSIPTYDDGFGPLWIHRDSMGISGIVRAQTWEDAYSICEDEFFPECNLTIDEIVKEYGFKREHVKIVFDSNTREERPAKYPEDYPDGKLAKRISFLRWDTVETPAPDAWADNELFQEACGFRPNGRRSMKDGKDRDPIGHGIYAKDLNGDCLDRLTPKLLAELEITLDISENE